MATCGHLPRILFFSAGCFLGVRMCFVSASSRSFGIRTDSAPDRRHGRRTFKTNKQPREKRRGESEEQLQLTRSSPVPRALEHTVLPFTANIRCKRMRSSTREVRFALSRSTRDHGAAQSALGGLVGSRKKDSFRLHGAQTLRRPPATSSDGGASSAWLGEKPTHAGMLGLRWADEQLRHEQSPT